MPHLSQQDKLHFKQEGYLVIHDLLPEANMAHARDALWRGIHADRADPRTWIGAEPRSPREPVHPTMQSVVTESPIFEFAEELAGKQTLRPVGTEAALIYPSGKDTWSMPSEGHPDGYYMPGNGVLFGTVDRFMLA